MPYAQVYDQTASATDVILITPSDSANLPKPVRGIRATGAGNVRIITQSGNDVVCAFAAGETRAIYATKVFSTNTTATGLEGLV